MTDMSKYKNVSLSKETYAILEKLSKVLLPDAKLSVAKTIEVLSNEKVRKMNGKLKKVKLICNICHGNGYIRVATGDTSIDFRDNSQVHQCWECDSQGEFYEYVSEDNITDVPNDDHSIN